MGRPQAGSRKHRLTGLGGKRKRRSTAGSSSPSRTGRHESRSISEFRVARILPPLIAAVLVALSLAALRIDILRIRYAVAASTLLEQDLLDESRELTARMRRLRDPVHLTERARDLGFVRPDRLIGVSITEPMDEPSEPRPAAHRIAARAPNRFTGLP